MLDSDVDLHALGERVRKLETQNRRWRLSAVVLALVFASSLTLAMKPRHATASVVRADIVKTQSLELTNTAGKVLARFGVNPVTGQATIVLYNDAGKAVWKAPGPLMVSVTAR